MLDKTATSLREAHCHHPFQIDGMNFKATLFAKPQNWSLSQLTSEDESVRQDFSTKLGRVLYDLGVGRALAPSPVKFTDRIIEPEKLTQRLPAGALGVYRNPDEPADGVPIPAGSALVISPSSCPVTLMTRGDTALGLHTGRFCLLDKYMLECGDAGRRYESVCHTALDCLRRPDEVHVKVFWSIPGHHFRHSLVDDRYKAINTAMYERIRQQWGDDPVPRRGDEFCLDLPKLIKAQCLKRGVPEENIDLTHAYHGMHGVWLEGKAGTPRNLVVLARHS